MHHLFCASQGHRYIQFVDIINNLHFHSANLQSEDFQVPYEQQLSLFHSATVNKAITFPHLTGGEMR